LNDFDATFSGSATAFQITGASDIDTMLNITVYTSSGVGKYRLSIPSSQTQTDYYILYSSFTGNPNFASVGAIEIFFDGSSDVDSIFSFFGIVGSSEVADTTKSTLSPITSVSTEVKTSITAKGNSDKETTDHSSAAIILPQLMMFVALLFTLF
jgi:hypothetical protein